MGYCELWLEQRSHDRAFRVALLVPLGFDTPTDFQHLEMQDKIPEREFYVSRWFSGISDAKTAMEDAAMFYKESDIQFLFFREIRPVTVTT